ncbi:hypothetical protein C772_02873 [Bhargavaea cecembensis DSE10]|uniref:Uncharacterized protein n=1 Tax=Bhargavaea cecembensis DSE10 TaxID=1235279 RepID=M7NDF0_9BACL|nr:hypothetical protein [Bhargavaea cecembensis]EMR05201.1 hypothetical protein C772_02873 [Bhargavaea cecembensis DSE10]
MLDYIFLLIAAIIVFPVLYYLMTKGKAGQAMVIMAAAGFVIALAGIYIQNHFAFYYSALAMIGLSFAAAVLIANRLPGETVTEGVPDELSEPIRLEDDRPASADDEIAVAPEDIRAGILAEDSDTIEPEGYREIVLPGMAAIEQPPGDLHVDESFASSIEDGELEILTDLDTPEIDLVPETAEEAVSPEPVGDGDYLEPIDVAAEPQVEKPDQPKESSYVDEEDYLDDGDLESWLEARPVPETHDEKIEKPEVIRDDDPFGLLTEEDWIVEEEEKDDGK